MGDNELSGTIPENIGALVDLEYLYENSSTLELQTHWFPSRECATTNVARDTQRATLQSAVGNHSTQHRIFHQADQPVRVVLAMIGAHVFLIDGLVRISSAFSRTTNSREQFHRPLACSLLFLTCMFVWLVDRSLPYTTT